MTDHQFEICDKIYIYSGISDYGQKMTYVVDLLNENEQLKQENKKFQGKYDHLLWLYNGLGCKYDWFKDENKQLKDLIIHLGYTIKYDDRHISLELKE